MLRLLPFFLLACAAEEPEATLEEEPTVSELLSRYLRGKFDSEEQSQSDPSYFNIELFACRVTLPELGEDVMYVQQQQRGSTPYRQRLYVVEGIDDTRARTEVYTVSNESDWVDYCDGDSTDLLADTTWDEREGCGVEVEWDAANETFTGGTVGTDCATSLGGDYADSEVIITPRRIVSWDRGFELNGTQVWGAVDGGYEFDRNGRIPTD